MSRSNVWCTNCAREFVATLDLSLNGNHEIVCPHCQHIHYRVVVDGEVTEERYNSSAGMIFRATTSTSVVLNYTAANTASTITFNAWANRTDLNLV
jgi:DNA-directed RNA polymerase subunit RPC12/RpoP